MTSPYTYRPSSNWIYFAFIAIIELCVVLGFAFAGKMHEALLSAINSLATDTFFFTLMVKPRIILTDEGVEIINPFQSVQIGWLRAVDFDTRFSFKVKTDKRTYSAWGATAPSRYGVRRGHESDFRGTGLESKKVVSPSDSPKAESGTALILSMRWKNNAIQAGTAGNHISTRVHWSSIFLNLLATTILVINFLQ